MPIKKQNKGVSLPSSKDGVYSLQEMRMLDQITLEVTEAWSKELKVIKSSFKKNQDLSALLNEMYHQVKSRLEMIESFFDKDGKFKSFDEVLFNQKKISDDIYNLEMGVDSLKIKTSEFCMSVKEEFKKQVSLLDKKFGGFFENIKEMNERQLKIQKQLLEMEKERRDKKWWNLWGRL